MQHQSKGKQKQNRNHHKKEASGNKIEYLRIKFTMTLHGDNLNKKNHIPTGKGSQYVEVINN